MSGSKWNWVKSKAAREVFRLRGGGRYQHQTYHPALQKALAGERERSDIYDHLGQIFALAVEAGPGLMVELGTRGGESTRALLAAVSVNQSTLLSVDIEDCRQEGLAFAEHWRFICSDDVGFGLNGFTKWCQQQGQPDKAKLIFIDTSHEYEHTKQEIAAWVPHLNERGILLFHDTNMGKGKFARMDGSISTGWDNQRGVIRAIEEYLGRQYDENSFFTDIAKDFLVIHYPHCNGLTVLKRLS